MEGNFLFYMSNIFLEALLRFQQVGSDSGTMQNTIEITVLQLSVNLPQNIVDLDLSYQNRGKHFILYVTHIFGSICKASTLVGSDSAIMESTVQITVFSIVWQNSTEHCLKCWWIWITQTKIEEKHVILYAKQILGSICKISNKLAVINALWKII